MQLKQLIALTYAISAASLALGLTATYINSMKSELHDQYRSRLAKPKQEAPATVTVVTAARPLSFGTRLTRSDFVERHVPAASAPLNVYHTIDSIFSGGQVQILQTKLGEGELVVPGKILQTDQRPALAMLLPEGLRAVTIRVNEVRGVGGFVKPQDRVDVLLTDNAKEEGTDQRTTRVLLQNVLVLAIGQEIKSDDNEAKVRNSVTMAVNLRDAQKLALAVTVGELSLALRNPRHPIKKEPQSISLSDLQPSSPNTNTVASKIQVFRAAKATVYTLSLSGSTPSE